VIYQTDNQLNQARPKLIQIFRYVQAFNHLQNPIRQDIQEQPWVFWLHNLPNHPCIRCGIAIGTKTSTDIQPSQFTNNQQRGTTESTNDDFILKVRRPIVTFAFKV
jgi:hypothetical protein